MKIALLSIQIIALLLITSSLILITISAYHKSSGFQYTFALNAICIVSNTAIIFAMEALK